MRICSFLPSATEIVYALGLHDQLYGVTFECDYPADARNKTKVVRSLFEHIIPPLSSGAISQIIGQRLQTRLGIYEVDQDVLQQGLEIIAEILHPELFSGYIPEDGAAQVDSTLARIS